MNWAEWFAMVREHRVWTHYKNGRNYWVYGTASNPNTGEVVIVYKECGHNTLYFRPHVEFEAKFRPTEPCVGERND